MSAHLPPKFLGASDRASLHEILGLRDKLSSVPLIRRLLDSCPEGMVILNRQNQIVLTNNAFRLLAESEESELLGLRPGEALRCIHANEEPAGCTTTNFCQYCGAPGAIQSANLCNEQRAQECRVNRTPEASSNALDLRIWATPLMIDGEPLTAFAIRDITDQKRREVLERIFFHDVLNAPGGLRELLRLGPEMDEETAREFCQLASNASEQLVEEIQSQRDLAAAESGELQVEFGEVNAADLLVGLWILYSHHSLAAGKTLAPPALQGSLRLFTSEVLLRRVLSNLVKNALEASTRGQTVRLSFSNDERPRFEVHNEGTLSEAVRHQLFQRSFTTKKGSGRGLGSYSVKLLTERYLQGRVSFTSTVETGTTFILELPTLDQPA